MKTAYRALYRMPLIAGALWSAVATAGPLAADHRIGASEWFVGGYAAASYRDLAQTDPELALDSLSGFIWWEGDAHWSLFAELELQDALIVRPGDTTTDEAYPALERLHVDYERSDALKLRAGKFLTPIGRWNVIHAAPLTWTTSRPVITENTFPTNATGLMLHGVHALAGRALEWSLYASPGEELFPEPDLDTFSEAYGLRLNYDVTTTLQLGASFADFEQRSDQDERKTLYGVDFQWNWRRAELSGEWALRTLTRGDVATDEQGYYLQAVLPVAGAVFGVARYETFEPAGTADRFHLYLGGLAWRPRPGLVLKGEFSRSIEAAPDTADGFRASIAVLF